MRPGELLFWQYHDPLTGVPDQEKPYMLLAINRRFYTMVDLEEPRLHGVPRGVRLRAQERQLHQGGGRVNEYDGRILWWVGEGAPMPYVILSRPDGDLNIMELETGHMIACVMTTPLLELLAAGDQWRLDEAA